MIALLIGCGATVTWAAAERGGYARQEISIEGLQYKPAELTVHTGDTVVWTNNDDRDHTVNARDNSFRSGNLRAGMSFEHTFGKAGRFPYGCTYHPRMSGVVIVSAN